MPATALQLEQWPIGRLVEYERNPRKNDDVVDRMAQAITEFGFRIPISGAIRLSETGALAEIGL
jgi:outer membrane biogenesis lipoprotein LolB